MTRKLEKKTLLLVPVDDRPGRYLVYLKVRYLHIFADSQFLRDAARPPLLGKCAKAFEFSRGGGAAACCSFSRFVIPLFLVVSLNFSKEGRPGMGGNLSPKSLFIVTEKLNSLRGNTAKLCPFRLACFTEYGTDTLGHILGLNSRSLTFKMAVDFNNDPSQLAPYANSFKGYQVNENDCLLQIIKLLLQFKF